MKYETVAEAYRDLEQASGRLALTDRLATLLAGTPAGLLPTLFEAVQRVSAAVPEAMKADGSFVGINNVVSQSVPHLHVHVVPRVRKDGLRGFFWPRQKYESDDAMVAVAQAIRAALVR